MTKLTCPICSNTFEAQLSAALPFCSDRCRQVDLGRWIDESYGMAVERAEEPSHESSEFEI